MSESGVVVKEGRAFTPGDGEPLEVGEGGAVTLRDGQSLDEAHKIVTEGLNVIERLTGSAREWLVVLRLQDERGESPSAPVPTLTDIGRLHAFTDDIEEVVAGAVTAIGEFRRLTRKLEYVRGENACEGAYYA